VELHAALALDHARVDRAHLAALALVPKRSDLNERVRSSAVTRSKRGVSES
jgi:hypothetical protein